MRIAWLTPFSKRSAIGRFSQYVTSELAKHIEVDLWVSTSDDLLPTDLRVVPFDVSQPLKTWWPAGYYDFAVCNFGDHLSFHQPIFEFSRMVPFVAIMHDFVMHHFFVEYYYRILKDLDAHLRRMEFLYGAPARSANDLAKARKSPWVWETNRVVEFPFFEDCLPGAIGAIAHSQYFSKRIASVYSGPVRGIPIAYPICRDGPVIPRHELPFPSDRVLMVTVGNVNENKRVEAVLETLAANPHLATRVYYTVCGEASLEVREKLSALAAVGNLKGSVLLNGWTPELELRSWLQAADICINLRNPAMEGGSATLAESMLLGKPAIVSDTGVYAELPDECVLKIRTTDEREDLASAISSLVSSFDLRCQMGALAKVYAEERFTAGAYCGSLLSFLNELQHIKPVFEPVHRAGGILREMEIAPSDPIVATIAEMSHKMFCAASSEAPWREP